MSIPKANTMSISDTANNAMALRKSVKAKRHAANGHYTNQVQDHPNPNAFLSGQMSGDEADPGETLHAPLIVYSKTLNP
jgi:hypothetical protein